MHSSQIQFILLSTLPDFNFIKYNSRFDANGNIIKGHDGVVKLMNNEVFWHCNGLLKLHSTKWIKCLCINESLLRSFVMYGVYMEFYMGFIWSLI